MECYPRKISIFKTSQTLFWVFWWSVFCIIDAANTILKVIIKIELGHYYLANKNTFSLFLSSIETQKKGYEGKLCMKHVYVLFHNIRLFTYKC